MKINGIANTREQGGDDVGLAIRGEADVAYQALVENLLNSFTVVSAAVRLAHHTRALAWREGFGHDAPL